ncbi:hypothetical protein LCGC14_3037000 [marine sediment metagenome]|uniref:Uncharacterized protein n=1 Tax=marine sediment metagenome TaxID=412755 RepID=A0A0F8WR69_9ZZZZ
MKDFHKTVLEDSRPNKLVEETVSFCLERLYLDKKHRIEDEVVDGLTFEELIGCLLQVRDASEGIASTEAKVKSTKECAAEILIREWGGGIRWCPFPRKWLIRDDGIWRIENAYGFEGDEWLRASVSKLEQQLGPGDEKGRKYLRSLQNYGPEQALLACIKKNPKVRLPRLTAKEWDHGSEAGLSRLLSSVASRNTMGYWK